MKALEPSVKTRKLVFASMLTLAGCSLLGRQSPPPEPVDDDPAVVFPSFSDRAPLSVGASGDLYALDGELLRALTISTRDFLPPESKDLPCELKPEAQRYQVIHQGDVFFISISENLAHCGHAHPALDSGARYAIHRDGRILRRQLDGQPEFPRETIRPHDDTWIQAEPGVTAPVESSQGHHGMDVPGHSSTDGGLGFDAG